MDTKDKVKKYFKKYWKEQYVNEDDDEFKALVKLVENKHLKQRIEDLVKYKLKLTDNFKL